MTLSLLTPSRSGSGALAATRVLWVCMTPLGSPVVPEVNISSVTSFGSGRSAASSAGSRRCSHGVSMNDSQDGFASPGWPSTTNTCCRAGQSPRSRSTIAG